MDIFTGKSASVVLNQFSFRTPLTNPLPDKIHPTVAYIKVEP